MCQITTQRDDKRRALLQSLRPRGPRLPALKSLHAFMFVPTTSSALLTDDVRYARKGRRLSTTLLLTTLSRLPVRRRYLFDSSKVAWRGLSRPLPYAASRTRPSPALSGVLSFSPLLLSFLFLTFRSFSSLSPSVSAQPFSPLPSTPFLQPPSGDDPERFCAWHMSPWASTKKRPQE